MYNFHDVVRENNSVYNQKYLNTPSHLYSILNNDGWRTGKRNALLKQLFKNFSLMQTTYMD